MLNIDELKKLYDEYLETLNDIVNRESYGTESDFAVWYIPDFIKYVKENQRCGHDFEEVTILGDTVRKYICRDCSYKEERVIEDDGSLAWAEKTEIRRK